MRQRASYLKPFKAQIVQKCLQLGVSLASIALRHGINANLVREWIPVYRGCQAPALPAFVPMKLPFPAPPDQQMSVNVEVLFGQQNLTVKWPSTDLTGVPVLFVTIEAMDMRAGTGPPWPE